MARSSYGQILDQHRERLERLTERRGVQRVRKLYDRAQTEVVRKLAAVPKESFSAQHQRVMLAQIQQGQSIMAARLAGELGDISEEAQVESLRGLGDDIGRMEEHFTGIHTVLPIDEASIFAGVIDKRRASLMRQHAESMAAYGGDLVTKMQDEMALSLASGESTTEAIDRISRTADIEWWRGERIVRTETAFAYSSATYDGIQETAKEMPGLMMRWVENCNDDGAPLDDRVGVDSIAMHGQVTAAGGMFTCPPSAPFPDARGETKVSPSLAGTTVSFPPLRPNGREAITPFRKEWGVPGWRWIGGRRVPV